MIAGSRTTPRAVREHGSILLLACVCYFPFLMQALHIDSDMLVHASRQVLSAPLDPKLGDYGGNMVLHDHTNMPRSSLFYRCGHPPLLPYVYAPVAAIANDREWPYHLVSFVFYLAAIYGVWHMLGHFVSPTLRWAGTVLWTISPALVVNSHTVMWDVPITAMMIWALSLLVSGTRADSGRAIAASGVVTGLAAVTKTNAVLLYPVLGGYLIATRRWRHLLAWLPGALAFPLAWVGHNLVYFDRIQYLSIGLFNPHLGDFRYRLERVVSFLGGCVTLPVFWIWLMLARAGHRLRIVPFALLGLLWGTLLVAVLNKPLSVGLAAAVFACAGAWCLLRMCTFGLRTGTLNISSAEAYLLSGYAAGYLPILIALPSASVRYMLPFVPLAVLALVEEVSRLSDRQRRRFLIAAAAVGLPFVLALATADYLFCEADRELPRTLEAAEYRPEQTWYFGRLSYEWYLFHAGYKNLRTSRGAPEPGDFLVHELIPGDYTPHGSLASTCTLEPLDTISFFGFPLRTKGLFGGFYGDSRLPYSIAPGQPQKAFVVYRLLSRRGGEDVDE